MDNEHVPVANQEWAMSTSLTMFSLVFFLALLLLLLPIGQLLHQLCGDLFSCCHDGQLNVAS